MCMCVFAVMPQKCCAPGCSANYDTASGYTSVFRFPADDVRRQQWINKIPRENLNVTKNTVICSRHFEQRFTITEDQFSVNGELVTVRRDRPKLTDDAYPSIFANVPSYLSTHVPQKRKEPADRQREIDGRWSVIP